MRIYAIGDLHLPGAQSKPMDVFGAHWEGHFEKIEQDWRSRVQPDDTVLVPGDLSWAMTLEEAAPDLARICALPGRLRVRLELATRAPSKTSLTMQPR